jgi:hypothetical protein
LQRISGASIVSDDAMDAADSSLTTARTPGSRGPSRGGMSWEHAKNGAVKADRLSMRRCSAPAAFLAKEEDQGSSSQGDAAEKLRRSIAELVSACRARLQGEHPSNLSMDASTDDQTMLEWLERSCARSLEDLTTAHTDATRRSLSEQRTMYETKLSTQRTASDVALKQEALIAEQNAMRRLSNAGGAEAQ